MTGDLIRSHGPRRLRPSPQEVEFGIPDREPDWRVTLYEGQWIRLTSSVEGAAAEAALLLECCAVQDGPRDLLFKVTSAGWYHEGREREGAHAFATLLSLAFPDRFPVQPMLPRSMWDEAAE